MSTRRTRRFQPTFDMLQLRLAPAIFTPVPTTDSETTTAPDMPAEVAPESPDIVLATTGPASTR